MKKSQVPLLASAESAKSRFGIGIAGSILLLAITGCQILTYKGPSGERFTRSSLGTTTSISSLKVEADTNGLRRVELQGYQNDSTQALGVVTDAAVKAALQSVK